MRLHQRRRLCRSEGDETELENCHVVSYSTNKVEHRCSRWRAYASRSSLISCSFCNCPWTLNRIVVACASSPAASRRGSSFRQRDAVGTRSRDNCATTVVESLRPPQYTRTKTAAFWADISPRPQTSPILVLGANDFFGRYDTFAIFNILSIRDVHLSGHQGKIKLSYFYDGQYAI